LDGFVGTGVQCYGSIVAKLLLTDPMSRIG